MRDNVNFMKTLLIIFILFLTACSDSQQSPTDNVNNEKDPSVSKSCTGVFQRAWIDSRRLVTEFNSDCTGKILSCDVDFKYSIINSDMSGGSATIEITKDTGTPGCLQKGDILECSFYFEYNHGSLRGMYVNCGNDTSFYTPGYGTN